MSKLFNHKVENVKNRKANLENCKKFPHKQEIVEFNVKNVENNVGIVKTI